MSCPKPTLVPLHQLAPGQFADFFALLAVRNRSVTRDGKPYFTCRFQDRFRTVECKVWSDSPWFPACEETWRVGQFYKVRALYLEHEKYGPQIDIQDLRPVEPSDEKDGFHPGELIERSRFEPAEMFAELQKLAAEHISDKPLRRLVLVLLERYEKPLCQLPATQNKFYPFAGGLLEHTLSVTQSCIDLVEKYRKYYEGFSPPLNKDLVVAGAILHDFGRILEFNPDTFPAQQTVAGQLFGHLFLGRDLVRETARELGDVNSEQLQLLEHIIITHLTLPEWGSPRLPAIPECLILHHADDLDAKMEMFTRCLTRDRSAGPFTDPDPVLKRPLLKERSV